LFYGLGFPSIPPLAAELEEHLRKCQSLEYKFTHFLESKEFDEQVLQAIDEEVRILIGFNIILTFVSAL
jgi:hypothetical protein